MSWVMLIDLRAIHPCLAIIILQSGFFKGAGLGVWVGGFTGGVGGPAPALIGAVALGAVCGLAGAIGGDEGVDRMMEALAED